MDAARTVEDLVITDPREADVGSIHNNNNAPFTGGTLSYIDFMGPKKNNKQNHKQKNRACSHGWLDSFPAEAREQLDFFAGDIRDPNGMRIAMKGCDAVCHLAALIAIPYSYHSPDTYVETNIRGTLNVLQAARDFDVSHVLHTSTSEVYGTAQFVPITEEHRLQGQSPYSAS